MASIKPHDGKWRAAVFKRGVRMTKVFNTKALATQWANKIEMDIDAGITGEIPNKTVYDLLEKYLDDITPGKRSKDNETNRIKRLQRDKIALINLRDLDTPHMAEWRDRRLKEVKSSSVRRDWTLLSNVFSIAKKEWKWLKKSPFEDLKRPKSRRPRDRLYTGDEILRIVVASGYNPNSSPIAVSMRVGAIFLFACETGMRLKEMTRLTWDMVYFKKKYLRVGEDTKTGMRDVPLSTKAIGLLQHMEKLRDDTGLVFHLTESQVDSNFRKIKKKTGIEGATFHDSKHYACTRLAEKINIMALAKMLGTTDLKTLMVYYDKKPGDIAEMLG